MRRLRALAVLPLLLTADSVLGSGTRLGLGAAPLGCAAAVLDDQCRVMRGRRGAAARLRSLR
ncbi:MAG: hypothetical protein JF886_02750 [Candidatus Dormibacteraeota bacterium]|uniref:Uncharacterized protein n=1 Tax=Candidatus Aeolococcus gillhamiae TaxID=3127015 RepID=A0A934JYR4_9BACT|nr:hypothetical protein [Candidatus Dormibacteraeota bacterium]